MIIAAVVAGSFVLAFGLGFAMMPKPNFERKKKASMKKHLHIPLSFWDDYNHANRRIQNMTIDNIDKCESLIDDLIYKYAEYMDAKAFWEKIETITMYFEMRKDLLLNK